MDSQPGLIVLLGSGETSPSIRKVYDWLFARMEEDVRLAILETPAGFEPNSDYVADQIRQYIAKHLQNYQPEITLVPARKRDSAFSTDDPAIVTPLYAANSILMGPGSPTYAVRQLRDSVAWHTLCACHRLGATLIFASAATLASSAYTLPVYEIYKVGEELHWKRGLNFFGDFGLDLVFISHWNNNDGGEVLDTSRCYMGQDRYNRLIEMLPPTENGQPYTIVGIDENTALIVDPAAETCRVMGPGGVIVIRAGSERRFPDGSTFDIAELGSFYLPQPSAHIPSDVWARTRSGVAEAQERRSQAPTPPPAVQTLLQERNDARARQDWQTSDRLRDKIEAKGWKVLDTPEGSVLEPA